MHTVHFATPWQVCTPTTYRYLPSEFVDAFFADGSIRLSSFDHFRQHPNETRLDANEGKTMFVHRNREGQGQTILARTTHGLRTYVLCGSMRHDPQLMAAFGCDAYIRIDDTTAFGQAVARMLPGCMIGAEGPCLYQDKKIIERDLGRLDLQALTVEGKPTEAAQRLTAEAMAHLPYFLKDKVFADQVEYRLLWLLRLEGPSVLDIRVPDARQFCSRPNALTE